MKAKTTILIGLCSLLLSTPTFAKIVTIGLEATVTYMEDKNNLFQGNIAVGSLISGYYTYNTDPPNASSYNDNEVLYTFCENPYKIYLQSAGYSFETDRSEPCFTIGIANNLLPSGKDFYGVSSFKNMNLSNGASVIGISFQLVDNSGMAIDNINLTDYAPILSDWPDYHKIEIQAGECGTTRIIAEVTSIIPEPATLTMLFMGGLFLKRHTRRS